MTLDHAQVSAGEILRVNGWGMSSDANLSITDSVVVGRNVEILLWSARDMVIQDSAITGAGSSTSSQILLSSRAGGWGHNRH